MFDEAWLKIDDLLWNGDIDRVDIGWIGNGKGDTDRAFVVQRDDVWLDNYGPIKLRIGVGGEGVNFYRAKVSNPNKVEITVEAEIEFEYRFQVLVRLWRERGLVQGYILDFQRGETLDVNRERRVGDIGRCRELFGSMLDVVFDETTPHSRVGGVLN